MDMLDRAIVFATKAHEGQKRKITNENYILHPLEVMIIISKITTKKEVWVAGLLHDVIEDTKVTKEEIKEEFGEEVLNLVLGETEERKPDEDKVKSWYSRKEKAIETLRNTQNKDIKIICLADKLSNLYSIVKGYQIHKDEVWNFFNQKDKNMHAWYYRELFKALSDLKEYYAYQDYARLYKYLFGEDVL